MTFKAEESYPPLEAEPEGFQMPEGMADLDLDKARKWKAHNQDKLDHWYPTPYNPTPHTLHPIPFTLHPTTLHPTTLHPIPHTLQP